jgi:adenylate cyclase class IV
MKFKEIELKYWAGITKQEFHRRVNKCYGDYVPPDYVVSCDDYYILNNCNALDRPHFVRFRKGGGMQELTLKVKEKENVVRAEINLDVSNNDDASVVEFLTLSGYNKAFQVYKEAWIWHIDDCIVISYYTLSDGRSVIELEAENYDSEEEALEILEEWHKNLGLDSEKKEKRSLYEIFTEEKLSL